MEQILYAILADQGGQAPGAPPGCAGAGGMLLPMLLMFAVIYFLIIRPQQKQQKQHKLMLSALKKGDKVVTNAGIFGTLTGLTDSTVTLEISKNVHIRMLRSQVAGLQPGEQLDSDAAPVVPGSEKKK